MARPKVEELQKHTLNLRSGDLDALAVLFPNSQPSVMVRKIVSLFVDQAHKKAGEQPVTISDISI